MTENARLTPTARAGADDLVEAAATRSAAA